MEQVKEIWSGFARNVPRYVRHDTDLYLLAYLIRFFEKKDYSISSTAISKGQWKADILLPDGKLKTFDKLYKTSFKARADMLLEVVKIYTKTKNIKK